MPTVANISPARKKLLDCLENNTYDSIVELCNDAGVDRSVYYDAIKSDEFVKLLFDNSTAGIYVAIPKILDKIIKQAKTGSFVHQKMLLEMMKIYQGTPQQQTNVQVNVIPILGGKSSED